VWWQQWQGEKANKHDLKTASSFIDVYAAYKIVTAFFNVYYVGEHDEQNSFDLELLPTKRSHPDLSRPVGLQSSK